MIKTVNTGKLQGVFCAPPSKSYAQRALLAAALSNGTSTILNMGSCKDTDAIRSSVEKLGATVSGEIITGLYPFHTAAVDVGESGLATRLLIPILALSSSTSKISGSGSLLSRRMDFITDPLKQFGANANFTDGCLPATVTGPLRPSVVTVDCSESSQFLSGLLFALPLLDSDSYITALNLKSRPYVDMTIDILSSFGVHVETENDIFHIQGNQSYSPASVTIEGDWSGVSTIITAPGCKTIRGLNSSSRQADCRILKVLGLANINFEIIGSDIKIFGGVPTSFDYDATDCPDLFPSLAVLAARVRDGVSHITGTNRLINKESNRLLSIRDEFGKMGVDIDISENNIMSIRGGQTVHGAQVDSHNDHRIAMALASLALLASDGETTINGAEAVNKSYRNFWNDFNLLYRYE